MNVDLTRMVTQLTSGAYVGSVHINSLALEISQNNIVWFVSDSDPFCVN